MPDNGSSASYISPFLAAEAFAHKYKISAMVKRRQGLAALVLSILI